MSESKSTRRRLIAVIVAATLVTLGLVIADLAVGGRPDPPELRAAATLLNGSWRVSANSARATGHSEGR